MQNFKEVANEWLFMQSLKHKSSTILKYTNIINNHLLPYFEDMDIRKINERTFCDFIYIKVSSGNLKKNTSLSPSYIKLIMIIFNSIIEYAVNMNYCEKVKMNYVGCPPIPRRKVNVIDIESQTKLTKYIFNNISHTGLAIALGLYAGLRIGEICALKWEEVDVENGLMSINHTISRVPCSEEGSLTKLILDTPKTVNSKRIVPINSKLLKMLNEVYFQSSSTYVISNSNSFISPRTLEYRYHKILDKCDIPSINFHGLRHTFATRCVESGVDVKTLSEILGHSSVNFTLNTYVHSSIEQKKIQIEKITLYE